jgi:formylglycine-generating enzyme required for sulfatase activity
MAGNVYEWINSTRALLGGSWVNDTDFLHCTSWFNYIPVS